MTKLKITIHGTQVEYDGTETFLRAKMPWLLETVTKSHNEQVKRGLLEAFEDLQHDLRTLDGCLENISRINEKLAQESNHLSSKLGEFLASAEPFVDAEAIAAARRSLQEMNLSFNLQYLMLQQQMQDENRQYTAVSNILKTKHDTVKNSISNIR